MSRPSKIGPHLGLEVRKDGTRYWKVYLPVFGPDRRPLPGSRREVVRLPFEMFSEGQAKAEMRRLYHNRLVAIEAQAERGAPVPMLVETLLRYHREVTCGPVRSKATVTARSEMLAIRDVAAWLIDSRHGRADRPSPLSEILPAQLVLSQAIIGSDILLRDFDTQALHAWRDYLARRVGPKTVNLRLSQVRTMLAWAVELGILPGSPYRAGTMLGKRATTEGARPGPAPRRHYTVDEVRAMDAAAAGEVRRFLRMAWLTGARRGQLLALTPADILVEEGLLRIPAGKTESYLLPLTAAVRDELSGFVGWPWGLDGIHHQAAVLRARLKIPVAQPIHGYRHGLATALREAGAGIEDVALWLGHVAGGRGPVTQVYDHARLKVLQRLAGLVPIPWRER